MAVIKGSLVSLWTMLLMVVMVADTALSEHLFVDGSGPIDDHFEDGDILLGGVDGLYRKEGVSDKPSCRDYFMAPAVQTMHAIKYAIQQVNKNTSILQNISLGFVMVNNCGDSGVSVRKALQFVVPPPQCALIGCNIIDIYGNTSGSSFPGKITETDCPTKYPVAGVIGPGFGKMSRKQNSVLSAYSVPEISWYSSNDDLSNKDEYPSFSRVIPPDRFQGKAIVDLIAFFNWTYAATVYGPIPYFQDGHKVVTSYARYKDICFSASHSVKFYFKQAHYDDLARKLFKDKRARVLVMFLFPNQIKMLIESLEKYGADRHYIFISWYDFASSNYANFYDKILGMFSMAQRNPRVPGFEEYYNSLSPWRVDDGDPWYGEYDINGNYGCQWVDDKAKQVKMNTTEWVDDVEQIVAGEHIPKPCNDYKFTDFPGFVFYEAVARIIDIVEVYVAALDAYIKDHCMHTVGDRVSLRTCIKGELLLSYIRQVQFEGKSGHIQFDNNGDILGSYDIMYFQNGRNGEYENTFLGSWNALTDIIDINVSKINKWYLDDWPPNLTNVSESVHESPSMHQSSTEPPSLPVSESTAKSTAESQPVSESTAESTAESQPVSESTAESTAVSTSESTAESISESQPVSKSTPESQPVSKSTPESQPVSKSTPESQPVSKSTPESQPVSKSTPESQPVSKSTPESQPVSGSTAEFTTESQSVSESKVSSEFLLSDSTTDRSRRLSITSNNNGANSLLTDVVLPIPESVCAKACGAGEYFVKGEVICCWECRKCRDNEYITNDQQGCAVCPQNTWPDQENFTSCEAITLSYMALADPMAIGLESLAALGIVSVTLFIFIFLQNSQSKVIRGSSRELMIPIMAGLLLAYLTVFTQLIKPSDWSCYVSYVGFHLSSTLIFGPLSIKTIRIYRIFDSAERCQLKTSGVDKRTQIILVVAVVAIEAGVVTVEEVLFHPGATVQMPILTEPFVELLCDVPFLILIVPLSFNLLLLIICAIFGFLTRHLPDNFNESWYIFISVTTTLFIWVAFLPTYLLAFYAYHKGALLSLALILNGMVTILCLFVPKVYALYFVPEKNIKISHFLSTHVSESCNSQM